MIPFIPPSKNANGIFTIQLSRTQFKKKSNWTPCLNVISETTAISVKDIGLRLEQGGTGALRSVEEVLTVLTSIPGDTARFAIVSMTQENRRCRNDHPCMNCKEQRKRVSKAFWISGIPRLIRLRNNSVCSPLPIVLVCDACKSNGTVFREMTGRPSHH